MTEKGMTVSSENLPAAAGSFDVKDNMSGVVPTIPAAKILHQGQTFKMSDDTKVDELVGIVLDVHNARSWWEKSYDEGGGDDVPDCFSVDGINAHESGEKRQNDSCMTCALAKFDETINRTPCRKRKVMHMLLDGEMMPTRVPFSLMNIKAVDSWIQQLSSKNVPYQVVKVRITLNEAHNKKGVEYSEVAFKNLEIIEDEDTITGIKKMHTAMLPTMRGAFHADD